MPRRSTVAGGTAVLGAAALALATSTIMKWEGERRVGYLDVAKVATACWGHTKTAVVGKTYGAAECRQLLSQDVAEHAAAIRPCIPPGQPPEIEAAMLSLGFNIGAKALCGSTAIRRLKLGDQKGACAAIGLWNKARVGGRLIEVRGLTRRRADERRLCESGLS